jgi:predicted DNA-binding transcriptional regulator YafY
MRLERLLAILMLILNRKRIAASELADKMGVSVRTIYRDIDTLGQAGFPIVAYQGTGGGFELIEGYRLDRNTLTFDEISSVISVLKGMNTALHDSRFETTLAKYAGLLTEKEKEAARFWQDRLVIDMKPWGADSSVKQKVALIREALQEDRVIRFAYTTVNGVGTVRDVEPMTLILKGTAWYVYGYCLERGDFRLFRLSRLSELAVTERRFTRREHAPVEEIDWDKLWGVTGKPVTLVLRFAPQARAQAEQSFGMDQMTPQPDGSSIVTVTYSEDEWVYSFLLGFGDRVEVLEPPRLRELIRDRARGVAALYADD